MTGEAGGHGGRQSRRVSHLNIQQRVILGVGFDAFELGGPLIFSSSVIVSQ